MLVIPIFFVSLIPAAFFFFWIRKQETLQDGFQDNCVRALKSGAICVLPVVLVSGVLALIAGLTGLKTGNLAIYQIYYSFIVLAFAEELCKFLALKRMTKNGRYSWFEYAAFMTIIGIGFEVVEAVVYAIGAGPMVMLIRGATLMHGGFGFVMGYFYGKAKATNRKGLAVLGFILAWLMHGMYDYSLTEDIVLLGEAAAAFALGLAAFAVVLLVLLAVFIKRRSHDEGYTTPLSD